MGCLLRLALAVALTAGLVLAGDGYLAGQAERRAGGLATAVMGAPAEVELPGRPFVLHLLRGRFPRVLLRARDVPLTGTAAVVPRLELALRDVSLSPAALLDGTIAGGGLPEARSGTFVAVLDEVALRALLGAPEELGLEIAAGEIRASVGGRVMAVTPVARDGGVALEGLPAGPVLSGDLAGLPGGPWIDRVEVSLGAVEIHGSLRDL